jgi:hypothetical protein
MAFRIAAWMLTFTVTLGAGLPTAAQTLQGGAQARAAVGRMLETLGGEEVWAAGRTIRIQLRGHMALEAQIWEETFWIDLQVPRGRYEISTGNSRRVIAWTTGAGWELRGDSLEHFDRERIDFEHAYWTREPNVIFHRLAAATPATRVVVDSTEDELTRITAIDAATGETLCWFAVNVSGAPVKWGTTLGDLTLEHVFGPLGPYEGGIRIPQWGATVGGVWRYEHLDAALTVEPTTVSFDPPRGHEQ